MKRSQSGPGELEAVLERLLAGTASEGDRSAVRAALVTGVLATGERAVAISGNASDVVIATGDGNTILSFSGADATAIREVIDSVFPTRLHELPTPPRDFTGRAGELAELTAKLDEGGIASSGLHGLGGIGKTALALKLAEQLMPRYPDAQIYLDLKGTRPEPLSVAEVMAHVIHAYHPAAKLPDTDAELQGLYRSVLRDQRALLLLDNAASGEQVEPLIPPSGCALLVTSRQHFALPGVLAKSLGVLTPESARHLLLTIAPRIDDRAEEVAELCGYLPLALRLAAGALVKFANISSEAFVQRLKEGRQRLQLIEASIALSYELLSERLQKQWRLLAVFPDTFDDAGAANVWGVELSDGQDVLAELITTSMVEWNEITCRYRLHDLVRLFADSRLTKPERTAGQGLHSMYYQTVLTAANRLYVEGGPTTRQGLALFDLEWPNIRTGQAWARDHTTENDEVATLCGEYANAGGELLLMRQNANERIEWLESALESARRLKNRAAEGRALGDLGLTYDALGETRRGIELHEQYLTICRESGDRTGEGIALGNLGLAYFHLGETNRAIDLYQQRLTIAQECDDRRGQGIVLSNLGVAHGVLGEVRQANAFLEQALIPLRAIGDRRVESNALISLGDNYFSLGEGNLAIEYFENALSISREIGYRFGEGRALGALGQVLAHLGEIARAIKFYKQSYLISREIGDRRNEGNALGGLGSAYTDMGETGQAVDYLERALLIFREIGYQHGEASVLGNLGYVYDDLGDTPRAVEFYQQQLTLTRKIEYRRGEANALWNMSLALDKLEDRDNAIACAGIALEIYEQSDDPQAGKVRDQLTVWRGNQEKRVE